MLELPWKERLGEEDGDRLCKRLASRCGHDLEKLQAEALQSSLIFSDCDVKCFIGLLIGILVTVCLLVAMVTYFKRRQDRNFLYLCLCLIVNYSYCFSVKSLCLLKIFILFFIHFEVFELTKRLVLCMIRNLMKLFTRYMSYFHSFNCIDLFFRRKRPSKVPDSKRETRVGGNGIYNRRT